MSLQSIGCKIGLVLGGMKTLILISILYIYMRCMVDGSYRGRETAKSINCPLFKYEDPSLIPRTPSKKPGVATHTCHPLRR